MPISEAARWLPPETVYVPPNMEHYAHASRQTMRVLETISPVVEKVSIDEAYLNVSGLELLVGPPEVVGQRAKMAIRAPTPRYCAIPCVGQRRKSATSPATRIARAWWSR